MSRPWNVRLVLPIAVLLALGLSAVGQGAVPTVKYRTFHPPHLAVQLDLPTTWALSESTGTHYVAYDTTVTSAPLGVVSNVDIETTIAPATSFDSFATAAIASVRQNDLGMDPSAVIQSRKIRLPAGQAVMVTHSLHQHVSGKPLLYKGIVYVLQHNGKIYSFSYSTPVKQYPSEAAVFQHSASTIRFR